MNHGRLWTPAAMSHPPLLDPDTRTGPIAERHALLINPFYPKDPHASFGKHVLTPTLALTSFAAATPAPWQVRYWDENLSRPPAFPPHARSGRHHRPPHLRERAFELARWYRSRGSKVILGGLHVLSCPEECAPHADALALGDGVQLWPRILADVEAGRLESRYAASYENDYRDDPPPRRALLPRASFLTTTSLIATRGCHNRCGFCYLATDGLRMPYRMRDPAQIAAEFAADGQPYASSSTTTSARAPSICAPSATRSARSADLERSRLHRRHDDPTLVRDMALAGCTGVFVGFESLTDQNLADARKKTPRTADYARRVRMLHDNGIQVNGSFVLGFDHDRKDVFARTAGWIEGNRLECATFHILTPYPATPLFHQMEADGRLLHRDWSLYDTAHAVFRPKHMTPRNWRRATPGSTGACSPTPPSGAAAPKIGAPSRHTSRCPTSISAPTASGIS